MEKLLAASIIVPVNIIVIVVTVNFVIATSFASLDPVLVAQDIFKPRNGLAKTRKLKSRATFSQWSHDGKGSGRNEKSAVELHSSISLQKRKSVIWLSERAGIAL